MWAVIGASAITGGGRVMNRIVCAAFGCLMLSLQSQAASVLFNFDDVPQYSSLPSTLTVDGLTAQFAATGQGFSIQAANVLGFTTVGFSGNIIYPNSIYQADLQVSFSQSLTSFSILYSPEEYGTDTSATMRVTAFMNGGLVGTNTASINCDTQGGACTWATGTLGFSSVLAFNSVLVHYDKTPATGGDYGPIFMADNMNVTEAPVPLSASIWYLLPALGGLRMVSRKRKV